MRIEGLKSTKTLQVPSLKVELAFSHLRLISSNRSRSLSLDSPNRKRADVKSVLILTVLLEMKPNVLPAISLES